MTKQISVGLRFSPARGDSSGMGVKPLPLVYEMRPLEKSQARFEGRFVLMPVIDLSRYTCRAVIDWIDLCILTKKVSQGRHVSVYLGDNLGRNPYVDEQNGTRFVVRLQDPTPKLIRDAIELIRDRWGLATPATVSAMEVALDWYAIDCSDQARWQMVAVLHRHFLSRNVRLKTPSDMPRYVELDPRTGKKQVHSVIRGPQSDIEGDTPSRTYLGVKLRADTERERILRISGHEAPSLDATAYHGRRDAPLMIRLQNKVSDQRDPEKDALLQLEPEQTRARVEATLGGTELDKLGLDQLADLGRFKFEVLRAHCFSFWLPTIEGGQGSDGSSPLPAEIGRGALQRMVFLESGVYGLDAYERAVSDKAKEGRAELRRIGCEVRRHPRVRRGENGTLLAYAELNSRCEKALRRLTKVWGALKA